MKMLSCIMALMTALGFNRFKIRRTGTLAGRMAVEWSKKKAGKSIYVLPLTPGVLLCY